MTLTLLLDLDDTLLDSNMENFIPAYFQALSETLQDLVTPEIMIQALMGGTRRMMEKKDPERFLCEVFDDYFFAKIGIGHKELSIKIDKFYDEIFPELKYLTKQRQDSIEFVQWAFDENISVIIATNPLFPLKAVQHRLRWAGLAPEDYAFSMVTSYENSHFTKENISYFPEILGKLGWPDGPVVMVGNDLKMDIEPAMEAGLPVFWMRDDIFRYEELNEIPQGRIGEVRNWLNASPPESLVHSTQKPSNLIATLRSTPAVMESFLSDLDEEKISSHSNPDEWSINEVTCHFRDVEIEVNLPLIQKILSQDNSLLNRVLTEHWAVERNYAEQNGKEALQGFIKARLEIVNRLDDLRLIWDRPVRHQIFGSSTLLEVVREIVEHDKAHIRQIFQIRNQLFN